MSFVMRPLKAILSRCRDWIQGGEKKKKDKSSSKMVSMTAAPAQPRADNIDLALDGVVAQVIGTLEKRMSREEIWSGSKEALITD